MLTKLLFVYTEQYPDLTVYNRERAYGHYYLQFQERKNIIDIYLYMYNIYITRTYLHEVTQKKSVFLTTLKF